MPFPDPPKPRAPSAEGVVYGLGDLIDWAARGAKAYADARAQGLACVNFYESLRKEEGKQ